MITALALLLLTAEPAALTSARAQLKAGKLDEVLFALEGQTLPKEHRKAAADVLAQAGSSGLAQNDELLALQLAQMALRQDASHALANEVAARASLKQQQFEAAERYADAWVQGANTDDARIFRAQLALDQADWHKVLSALTPEMLAGDAGTQVQWMRGMAQSELDAKKAARADAQVLEEATAKAAAEAKAYKRNEQMRSAVVLYARDPNICTQVKTWLKSRDVPYVEKLETNDAFAFQDLARDVRSKGRNINFTTCVAVIRGAVFDNFDPARFDQALNRP